MSEQTQNVALSPWREAGRHGDRVEGQSQVGDPLGGYQATLLLVHSEAQPGYVRKWEVCVLHQLSSGRCTYQPVVQVRQDLDTLSLQQCKSCCHTAGENPWEQRESEREHPELVVVTLKGKPQILLMMNSDWQVEISILEIYGCKPLSPDLSHSGCLLRSSCGKVTFSSTCSGASGPEWGEVRRLSF